MQNYWKKTPPQVFSFIFCHFFYSVSLSKTRLQCFLIKFAKFFILQNKTSCEFCNIFKNTYFAEPLRRTASNDMIIMRDSSLRFNVHQRYTNTNLKISFNAIIYIKIIPWKFRILNPGIFLKSRLFFNLLYCLCIFVNKHFPNLMGT